jgi:hypothetical protein
MEPNGTYFYDEDGKRLGSHDGVIPIPLYKGMEITIHGYDGIFKVIDWNYHHGHPDEEAGLRIMLKKPVSPMVVSGKIDGVKMKR